VDEVSEAVFPLLTDLTGIELITSRCPFIRFPVLFQDGVSRCEW